MTPIKVPLEWVSVKDRVPEVEDEYLVWYPAFVREPWQSRWGSAWYRPWGPYWYTNERDGEVLASPSHWAKVVAPLAG